MVSPSVPVGRPTRAQVQALHDLGLSRAQRRTFFQGLVTVYYFPSGSEPAIAVIHLAGDKVRSGIIDIHDVGGGLGDLARFRKRSLAVARAFGAARLELFGGAFINPRLEALLLRQGYAQATEAVPEELGGGTIEIVTRVFPVT